MEQTPILGLKMPSMSDYVTPNDFNENFKVLDKLGATYILSDKKNGEWFVREWSDGRYDCWMAKSFSDKVMNSTWGSLYMANIGAFSFPVTFVSTPHMTVTWDTTSGNTAFAVPNIGLSTVSTGSLLLCSPVSGQKTTGVLSIHVSGSKTN